MNKDLILREKLALQRTILANQTTFLAFIRTSMYFLVAGISIKNLTNIHYAWIIEFVFVSISIILLFIGILNYQKQHQKIKDSKKHVGKYVDEYLDDEKNS
jgi:putative membrane protein